MVFDLSMAEARAGVEKRALRRVEMIPRRASDWEWPV
jgi:hypothetical protein